MGHYLWPQFFLVWCSSHLSCAGLWSCRKGQSIQWLWCRGTSSNVCPRVHGCWEVCFGLPHHQFLLRACCQCRSEVLSWSVHAWLEELSFHTAYLHSMCSCCGIVSLFLVSTCMVVLMVHSCLLYYSMYDVRDMSIDTLLLSSKATLRHRTLRHRTLIHRTLIHRTLRHRTLRHRTLIHRTLRHRTLIHRLLRHM